MIALSTSERIRINLLTGFLGAGKTTLLNGLLRHPELRQTAVIVNEFGDVGIDHLLVAQSSDKVIELANGCLCCTIHSDLVTTLFGLYAGRVNGNIPPFDRVIIETTGLAEPAPILLTLFRDAVVAPRFVLDSVLTVVDAVNGSGTLDLQPESALQISAADRLFLTKTDLATADGVSALKKRLEALNPGCPVHEVTGGAVAPAILQPVRILEQTGKDSAPTRWVEVPHPPPHVSTVASRTAVYEQAIAWEDFLAWVNAVRELLGPHLLRIKGLMAIAGRDEGPLVVHAVQNVFHPPKFLPSWPSSDRRSRLVFITRDIDAASIDRAMEILGNRLGGNGQFVESKPRGTST
jgi:G3E family GTPase